MELEMPQMKMLIMLKVELLIYGTQLNLELLALLKELLMELLVFGILVKMLSSVKMKQMPIQELLNFQHKMLLRSNKEKYLKPFQE